VQITARNESDIDPATIMRKVADASGSKYSALLDKFDSSGRSKGAPPISPSVVCPHTARSNARVPPLGDRLDINPRQSKRMTTAGATLPSPLQLNSPLWSVPPSSQTNPEIRLRPHESRHECPQVVGLISPPPRSSQVILHPRRKSRHRSPESGGPARSQTRNNKVLIHPDRESRHCCHTRTSPGSTVR
jgi:hypothetical protein